MSWGSGERPHGIPDRLPDWRRRLELYLAEVANRPFAFGRHDCGLFAAGAIEAMTGKDPGEPYRDRYGSFKGALKALRKDGFADHLVLANALFSALPVARARPGDLAAVETGEGPAFGIVQGEQVYLAGEAGLRLVPLTDAARAWRVG